MLNNYSLFYNANAAGVANPVNIFNSKFSADIQLTGPPGSTATIRIFVGNVNPPQNVLATIVVTVASGHTMDVATFGCDIPFAVVGASLDSISGSGATLTAIVRG